jgi:hypothetical protein
MVATLIFILFFLVIYLTRPNNQTGQRIGMVVYRIRQFQQHNPLYLYFSRLFQKKERKDDILYEPIVLPAKEPVVKVAAPVPNRAVSELTGRVYTTPIESIEEKPVPITLTAIPQTIVPQPEPEAVAYSDVIVPVIPEEVVQVIASAAKPEPDIDQDAVNQLLKLIENIDIGTIVATPKTVNAPLPEPPKAALPVQPVKQREPNVIDIDLTVRKIVHEPGSAVPAWSHTYVYSVAELQRATPEQLAFYALYKACFLKGEHLNLEGHTNYGFILFYDLLGTYETHKDLALLERRLRDLEISCPRTRSYAHTYLIQKMRSAGDFDGANRIAGLAGTYQSNRPDGESWDWKVRHTKRLKLNPEEVKILQNVWISSNTFVNIDFCAEQLTKLYIGVIKSLRATFTRQGTTERAQFEFVSDLVARKQYRYHKGSANYNHQIEYGGHTICMYIFRYCESVLRTQYGHKRKVDLSTEFDHTEVMTAFQERVLVPVWAAIAELLPRVDVPDDAAQKELNRISPTRWKDNFELTEAHYQQAGRDNFMAGAAKIVELNSKNPSLDIVCMDLAKFLSSYDKPAALHYYLRHCHHSFKVKRMEPKPLTKAVQKYLLVNDAQTQRFNDLVDRLKQNADLEAVLYAAKEFYEPVRKKIVLDPSLIRQVEQQHSGTVELLNEYLKDEEPVIEADLPVSVTVREIVPAISTMETTYVIELNTSQSALLNLFKTNDFVLSRAALSAFCKTAGAMRDPLINGINETCYDLLDDTLIEEDGNDYIINLSYYNQLLNL